MIRIHHEDEEELRWWADAEYEGEMGRRSAMGGVVDALERGGLDRRAPRREPMTERALAAARRLRRVEERLARCTERQRYVLMTAFQTGDGRGLLAYGSYPRAAIACAQAEQACRQAGRPLSELEPFLRGLAGRAASSKAGRPDDSRRTVAALRQAAEAGLAAALRSFGARFEEIRTPGMIPLMTLAQSLRSDVRTVKARLAAFGVGLRQMRNLRTRAVRVSELHQRWPEAARALANAPVED